MHYSTRSFLGHPSDTSWSQYWENEPDDPSLRHSRGHLFGLINLEVASGQEASPLGHQLIQVLNTAYYLPSDASVSEHLHQTLVDITSHPDYQLPNLTLVLAVVHHQTLHLACYNPAQVILVRGSRLASILQGLTQDVAVISGPLEPEDKFLLATDDFIQQYGWDRLKTFLSLPRLQDIEENILSLLGSLSHQSTLAAALILAHSDEVSPPVAPPPPSSTLPHQDRPSFDLSRLAPVGRLISKFFSRFTPRRQSVYVGHHQSVAAVRRHRLNIFFSLVVLTVLTVSIYLGARHNRSVRREADYQSLRSQFETKYRNAQAIRNLNLTEAQSLAREADKILSQMNALSLHPDEVSRFQSDTRTLLSQTGSPDAYQPELFYDTSLIGAGAHYRYATISQNSLYLLDDTTGRLDLIDTTKKSHQNLALTPDLVGTTSLAVDKNRLYFLKGQQLLTLKNQVATPALDLSASVNDFSSGQIGFWNSNLYLLSLAPTPSLWKFTPNSSGFSPGRLWLKDGQLLPPDSSAIALSGSIWVLSAPGQIHSYNLGTKDKLVLNPNLQLSSATNLVTNTSGDVLAFTVKNIVYLTKKSDNSVISYNFGSRDILSLVFDSSGKTLLLLCSDQKIYKISL